VLSPWLAAGAQGYAAMQPMATRADLTALADRLSRGSEVDRNKANALRARLREGDFRPGDRIRLVIDGSVTQDDTIAVVAGSKVQLKDVGEIPLSGVLRSELQPHMSTQIARIHEGRASPGDTARAPSRCSARSGNPAFTTCRPTSRWEKGDACGRTERERGSQSSP
jgi:hypothetical protein